MVGGVDLQYYQILYSPIRQPTSWRMITFQSFSHKSESSELPGSSPGGCREFEAGTASARIRKQLLN